MANRKIIKSFVWGALTGAVTGAVTALLFAPKPGRELRRDIADTAQKVGEKTAEVSRQTGAAVQSLAKRTTEFAADAKQAAERFVTDIRNGRSCDAADDREIAAAAETSADDNRKAL